MSEIESFLDKAARSFAAAERLLAGGDVDFAASRSYYGCFYVAEALLRREGLSFSRHGQVIAQYGRLFAKTGRLDPRFHRLLDMAFSFRQPADYEALAVIDPAHCGRDHRGWTPLSGSSAGISPPILAGGS